MEIFAVIFTLLCVWLAMKRNVLSWPIGLIGVILYSFIFWNTKLYSDFILQIIFFIQGIIGWLYWFKNKEDNTNKTKIDNLTSNDKIKWVIFSIISYIIISLLLSNYTDASAPWIDSFVAINSLIANWLLAKRKIENWYIWIMVDIIYIGLFIYKELYLSAGLYLILGIISVNSLIEWNKQLKLYKNNSKNFFISQKLVIFI